MDVRTPQIHHVTAIGGDPTRNADFYVGTLGLRFLKRTVNHDDTRTYHFYFGDAEGTPGTNLTFFPWGADARPGRFGAGQTSEIAFAIRPESIDYWADRLADAGVAVDREERSALDETVLRFEDPDGIGLALVAPADGVPDDAVSLWADGPVPVEHQVRGFHGVTLAVADADPTAEVLTDVYGLTLEADIGTGTGTDADTRRRYRTAEHGLASVVDLVETDAGRGEMGVGTVHHVAFAAADTDEQETYRQRLSERGLRVTEIVDRIYFESIYSREPGGVLIETATMGPGFTVDEPVDELGSGLVLPDWLEDERESIQAALPDFEPPEVLADD